MRPAFELAQVIDRFGKKYYQQYRPNSYIQRTLDALHRCRTSSLGGHVDRCEKCGHIRISYNSCRNRHCPKCQNTQREEWIENRKQDLLPVPYFHVVFTVPDKLNPLFIADTAGMYIMSPNLRAERWGFQVGFFVNIHSKLKNFSCSTVLRREETC
ncbi:MAG: hypothetical protein FJY10_11820 [Bacteroidetes bacterium]|nr:hypothetical protein [Bacteroidota bacterium]